MSGWIQVSIKDDTKAFNDKLAATLERNMGAAAEALRADVVRRISLPQPPSAAGESPHASTGKLRQSIYSERISRFVFRVATSLKYGRFLEYGTSKMAARPYLRPALFAMRKRCAEFSAGE